MTVRAALVLLVPFAAACTGIFQDTVAPRYTVAYPRTWREQPTQVSVARRERLEVASRAGSPIAPISPIAPVTPVAPALAGPVVVPAPAAAWSAPCSTPA